MTSSQASFPADDDVASKRDEGGRPAIRIAPTSTGAIEHDDVAISEEERLRQSIRDCSKLIDTIIASRFDEKFEAGDWIVVSGQEKFQADADALACQMRFIVEDGLHAFLVIHEGDYEDLDTAYADKTNAEAMLNQYLGHK